MTHFIDEHWEVRNMVSVADEPNADEVLTTRGRALWYLSTVDSARRASDGC